MNNCSFVGRLTRDPEVKTTQGGHSIARFTIAVDRDFKNDQGEFEADFINCVAWRGTADFIGKWFTKGKPIAILGSLQIRKYQARDGSDRWASEIQVNKAWFVPAPPKEQSWQEQVGAVPATDVVATSETFLDPDPLPDDQQLPFDF